MWWILNTCFHKALQLHWLQFRLFIYWWYCCCHCVCFVPTLANVGCPKSIFVNICFNRYFHLKMIFVIIILIIIIIIIIIIILLCSSVGWRRCTRFKIGSWIFVSCIASRIITRNYRNTYATNSSNQLVFICSCKTVRWMFFFFFFFFFFAIEFFFLLKRLWQSKSLTLWRRLFLAFVCVSLLVLPLAAGPVLDGVWGAIMLHGATAERGRPAFQPFFAEGHAVFLLYGAAFVGPSFIIQSRVAFQRHCARGEWPCFHSPAYPSFSTAILFVFTVCCFVYWCGCIATIMTVPALFLSPGTLYLVVLLIGNGTAIWNGRKQHNDVKSDTAAPV